MGRPAKEGMDYFPLNLDIFEDDKILLAQELIDPEGKDTQSRLLVPYLAIRILREIYKVGYYIDWNTRVCVGISSKIGCGITMSNVNKTVDVLLESGFLCKNMYELHTILTSNGIQKRWIYVMKSTKRKFKIEDKYNVSENSFFGGNASFLGGNPPETGGNPPETVIKCTNNISFILDNTVLSKSSTNTEGINEKEDIVIKKEEISSFLGGNPPETGGNPPETGGNPPETGGNPPETGGNPPETGGKGKKAAKQGKINYEVIYPFNSDEFKKMWNNWKIFKKEQFRFDYKSSFTEQASLNDLVNISKGIEVDAIAIILQSMAGGWRGFFALKNNSNEPKIIKQPNGSDAKREQFQSELEQRMAYYASAGNPFAGPTTAE